MKTAKKPSPARSQGQGRTPRREKARRTRSVGSPATSDASGRLTSVLEGFTDKNDSFALVLAGRKSILTDNTDIADEPRRRSWWKKLNENSRDVMEILEDNNIVEPNNIMEDLDIEVLSQENQKKNYTIDLPESSDGESINSIVLPQRKLFTQKENQPQKKFGEIMGTRDTLTKINKNTTVTDKTINAGTKELFQNKQRSKPMFPAALLTITPDKTLGDKTKELATAEPKGQVRNIFGNRAGTKRKNMFANFIVSESEDEIPDIQPKVFGFPKKSIPQRRGSSQSKRSARESSPASVTTDNEMDDWKHLPSSTMVEHQFEAMFEGVNSPVKRPRLGKLSETKESEASNKSKGNKSVAKNTSKASKNSSKVSSDENENEHTLTQNKSQEQDNLVNKSKDNKSATKNTSMVTRNRSIVLSEENEKERTLTQNKSQEHNNSVNKSKGNKSKNKSGVKNKSKSTTDDILNGSATNKNTSKKDTQSNKSTSKNKSLSNNKTVVNEYNKDVKVTENMQTHEQNKETNQLNESWNHSNKIQKEVDKSQDEIDENQDISDAQADHSDDKAESKKANESGEKHTSGVDKEVVNESPEIVDGMEEANEIQELNQNDNEANEAVVQSKDVDQSHEAGDHQSQENVDESKEKVDQSKEKIDKSEEVVNLSQEVANHSQEPQDTSTNELDQSQVQDASDNEADQNDEEDKQNHNDNEVEQSEEIMEQSKEQDVSNNENDQSQEAVNEIQENDGDNVADEDQKVDQSQQEQDKSDNEVDQSQHDLKESDNEVDQSQQEQDESENEVDLSQQEKVESDNDVDQTQEEQDESDNEVDQSLEQDASDNEVEQSQEIVEESEELDEEEADESEQVEQSQENNAQSENDAQSDNENDEQSDNEENDEQSDNEENGAQSENDAQNESQEQENEQSENEANLHYDSEEMEVDNYNETNENTNQDSNQEEIVENSQNISHDTTGRHRQKHQMPKSPDIVLRERSRQNISYHPNPSLRRTSMIKSFTAKVSLEPQRDSVGKSNTISTMDDGTTNSSAEGSGWDSHRTTRKTIRQTFGKDFSIRKSLRTLVMEKSAKRQTLANKEGSETAKFPLANSTELPGMTNMNYDDHQESTHEVSFRTRQMTLEAYMQKIKMECLERKAKLEEAIRNPIKTNAANPFKVPARPLFPRNPVKPINKVKKQPVLKDIPEELVADMQYKPPKRFRPKNAAWATNRLYKYLETKLEPKYDYKARVRSEKLVETIYQFTKDLRRQKVASTESVDVLKYEMARLDIVKTHYEFYNFFHQFMPREVIIKVVPDVVNKIPLPRRGVFADIIVVKPSQG